MEGRVCGGRDENGVETADLKTGGAQGLEIEGFVGRKGADVHRCGVCGKER